jgi:rSAM/selenodomain-associated transferase 1
MVLVFAKAPVPGRVKTRLLPGLSAAQAAALHDRMVARAMGAAADSRLGPVTLYRTPGRESPALRAHARRVGAGLAVQQGVDLGERMHAALDAAVRERGAALLMGSDCPDLDARRLREAARALADGAQAVLIPAVDGGYVLVGCRAPPPASLFRGVPWGTSGVMDATRVRLAAIGWRWQELSPLRDIDRVQDLDLLPPDLRVP